MAENEFNLHIPRYVDTFEPEPLIDVGEALKTLGRMEVDAAVATSGLRRLLDGIGYETD